MIWFLNFPLALRIALLLPVGAALGSLVNWAIYALAWQPRSVSPWSHPPKNAPPRQWSDRIPIYGWFGLRREASIHGRGFWIRPLLLEIAAPLALAAIYWWDTVYRGYLGSPIQAPVANPGAIDFGLLCPSLVVADHARFLAHALLLVAMLAATFIDFDEKTIPDTITIPGTLLGLMLAVMLPWSMLPHVVQVPNALAPAGAAAVRDGRFTNVVGTLTFATPHSVPAGVRATSAWALTVALACYVVWCVSLLDRRWSVKLPWRRAAWLFLLRATRGTTGQRAGFAGLVLIGIAGILTVSTRGGPAWIALFSALVGLAVGGGMIWIVRLIGRAALGREAMGFGDVTLMAMIGAFVGWQAVLSIFFAAPFAGLVIGVLQLVLRNEDVIPYGPFLCLATAATVVLWSHIWHAMHLYFMIAWLIPSVMGVCFVLMLVLLAVYAAVKKSLRAGH